MDQLGTPRNLDEAVETLMAFYSTDIQVIRDMDKGEFVAWSHLGLGMFLRNTWCLFWFDGHPHDEWPKEKPALVKYFNDHGIRDADDMSREILKAFFEKVKEENSL